MNDPCARFLAALALAVPLGPAPAGAADALTLPRAVELALAHAPALAVAIATDAEASASARLAADASAPELWVTTTPGYAKGLPGAVAGRLPAVAGVELRRNLLDPGRRADALEASSRQSLTRAGVDTSRSAVARAAVVAYSRCWQDEELVATAERRLEVAARRRLRTEGLRAEGRATPLEGEQAALEEARARQARLDRLSDRDLDQLELRRLIGWPAEVPLVLAGDLVASLPDTAKGGSLERARSADLESRALSEAAEALGRAADWRARSWTPVVDVDAQYARLVKLPGYEEFYGTFEPNNWTVGISVAFPVWNGGRTADAVARLRASEERLLAQRRAREAELGMQVQRAEAALGSAGARASLARRAEGVAEEALRVARALAEEGRAGPPDVEARELARADAHDELVRAEAEALAARVQLLDLRGELLSAWVSP